MSHLPTRTQVLIVGAGPTGLTLALALVRQGVDCLVVDKLPAPLPWSRALGMHARTLEILDALEVLPAINERSLIQTGVNVYGTGGLLFELDLTTLHAPHPHVLSCPQSTLEEELTESFTRLGGTLLRGCELLDFEQNEQGVVAQLEWAQQPLTLEADLLIGCDGAGSRVRHQLGLAFDGVQYADHFLLADLDIDWSLQRDHSHGFLLPGGALLALPMPRGWRLVINQPADADLSPVADIAPFRERLQACLGEVPTLSEPRWVSRFSIHRRLVSHYRRNRVLLAGDACHIQSPLGAQGMNTGIADAFNLAWKLALYLNQRGDGELLDSYEQERRPVAKKMLHGVDFLSRSSFASNRLFVYLRDQILRLAGRRSAVGRRLLRRASQLDVNYRNAPMSLGQTFPRGETGPLAGDRVPDADLLPLPEGEPVRLHSWLRSGRFQVVMQLSETPGHADIVALFALADRLPHELGEWVDMQLIAAGRELPRALNDLRQFPVALWQDSAGEFRSRFAEPGHLWLIRPDGHLGWRGGLADADQLLTWLERWFRRR